MISNFEHFAVFATLPGEGDTHRLPAGIAGIIALRRRCCARAGERRRNSPSYFWEVAKSIIITRINHGATFAKGLLEDACIVKRRPLFALLRDKLPMCCI